MEYQYAANKFVEEWIPKNKKFLDLACGNCQLLDYAKNKGCDVTGIDIKPQRKDIKKHDLNKKLPFKDKSFDVVACIDSLEHVKNVSNVFLETKRVLKDGGIFIVTMPNTKWYKNHDHISYFSYKFVQLLINYSKFKIDSEKHFIGVPKMNKYFTFPQVPEACFHFVFKLRNNAV